MASLDTTCLDRLSAEAEVPRQQVAKVLKGLERYLAQDIDEESRDQLQGLRKRYSNRVNLAVAFQKALAEAKLAGQLLIDDGHPNEPGGIVDRQVIEDLDENLDTLVAARARFTPRPITTTGRLIVGEQQSVLA